HSDISLHQLRIFTALAQATALTEAAKLLGIAQPSLSQQLSRLETVVGTRLFNRRPGEMQLTEGGRYLLPKAEQRLRVVGDLEAGPTQYTPGRRMWIRGDGFTTVLRPLRTVALEAVRGPIPQTDFATEVRPPPESHDQDDDRRTEVGLLADPALPT